MVNNQVKAIHKAHDLAEHSSFHLIIYIYIYIQIEALDRVLVYGEWYQYLSNKGTTEGGQGRVCDSKIIPQQLFIVSRI